MKGVVFMSTTVKDKNMIYWIHVAVFLLITFGFGFLPPIAQVTPMGMKVLGVFLGVIYGWLFIALDWPSLVALLALGVSGYATNIQDLFVSGWSYYVIPTTILCYLFAEALAKTQFTQFITNKLMSIKYFNGKPYMLMLGILLAAELMFILRCGMAGMFLLWSMVVVIAEKAGYSKVNKFTAVMIPAILVVYVLSNFMFPFNAGSLVMIGLFKNGMAATMPGIEVSFLGWTLWWLIFTTVYIFAWVAFVKFIFRYRFTEIASLGDELQKMGDANQKMNFDQKFGLTILVLFILGMFLPELLPDAWALTQLLSKLGLMGILTIALCVMCAFQKSKGQPFITLQGTSKGIQWNIIWLLVATEPIANAFNANECGIMPSIMAVVTPILTQMSPTVFLLATMLILGLITQVVHNFVLMVVFIPLLAPMYAGMGGNPFVLLMGYILILNMALSTPAASYTSALMFGQMADDKKNAYIQGFAHFAFSFVLFALVGWPLATFLL